MIGELFIKEARTSVYTSNFDNPYLRTLVGAGLGGLVGIMYSDRAKYINEHDKREYALAAALKGMMLGGGVGLASTVLGSNIGDTVTY